MRAYLALLSARFRALLQYRSAALAGLGTQIFWGLIRSMIFTAFYQASSAPQPMTLGQTISYVWLGQAMLLIIPWNLDRDVGRMVRTGDVAYELLRPVDLYWAWYVRAVALRIAPVLLRCAPMFVAALLFFGLQPPASFASAIAFLGSISAAVLLSAAITMLLNVSLFWTVSGEGAVRLLPSAVMLLSGMIIPLPLLPDWARHIVAWLPFRGLMDVPFRLYLGHAPPAQALRLIAGQLAWTAALVIGGRALIRRGLRRAVIQGG